LAGSTTKRALIRRFERESLAGYVNPASYLQPAGVEVLSEDGVVTVVPYGEVKSVDFVREFAAPAQPERNTFLTRPKMVGLWVSLRFRDEDVLEAILPNNLLLVEPHGFVVIPPEPFGNRQRLFVPRQALTSVEVLGVVGSPLKRRKPKEEVEKQIGLFDA
jgi:hypothetical protein